MSRCRPARQSGAITLNKALIVILSAVLLDAVGIGLIFPILPALLRDVTHTGEVATLIGVMLALYSAMQFLFAPVLGVLSDRFGRRPILLISLAGAAMDYLLMTFAPELWLLVLGRAIAGITSANMAVATAYITDISAPEQRARRFGLFHAMFGIGFIVGPVLGGILGDIWVRAPFLLAAALNAMNFALALFVLPESRKGTADTRFDPKSLNPFRPLGWALNFAPLLPLIAIFVIMNFVGTIYGTVWAIFGEDAFGFDGNMIGLSLAVWGVFHAGAQALLTGPAAKLLGERWAMVVGMGFELLAMVLMGIATVWWVPFALAPVFALGGIGMPALQSMTTRQVDEDNQGKLQGVLSSLVSLSAVFGPLLFSTVYFAVKPFWPGAIWLVAGGVYLLALPLVLRIRRTPPAMPLPHPEHG
jgi:MFS transporter, DHA1 family, tetracycline resistance protein